MVSRVDEAKIISAIPHIKCRWNATYREYRVTIDGLSKEREEAVAYYCSDYDDAYATAEAMSAEHARGLTEVAAMCMMTGGEQ
jgi:hypothetical protein